MKYAFSPVFVTMVQQNKNGYNHWTQLIYFDQNNIKSHNWFTMEFLS